MLNEQTPYDPIEHALKKRKSQVNYSINKRIRTSIPNEKILRTTIENLPNELFYEIFSYLTDDELLTSFRLLTKNKHFDQLIYNRTSINLRSIRRLEFIKNKSLINSKILRQVNLFNNDDTPGIINLFFSLYSFDLNLSFPNLQNLVLDQPEQNDLIVIFIFFISFKTFSFFD